MLSSQIAALRANFL
ncbi:hypothetical protein [Lysobacter enzymogenes]